MKKEYIDCICGAKIEKIYDENNRLRSFSSSWGTGITVHKLKQWKWVCNEPTCEQEYISPLYPKKEPVQLTN